MRLSRALMIAALVTLSAGFARLRSDPPGTFPHRKHARLFPTSCVGCHAGIPTEAREDRFPSTESCAQCHNGRDQKPVSWDGRIERATNLKFSHAEHAREAGKGRVPATVECQSCHHEPDADGLPMAVTRAVPANCLGCHAHRATEHLAEQVVCSTCHVPLAQAVALSDSAVSALPKPAWHGAKDFISSHGAKVAGASSCATCHSRESCARCHPNGDRVADAARLGADARVARLVRLLAPVYPTPASHRVQGWREAHGVDARRDVASCANCHTQASCRGCHAGGLGRSAIATLAVAEKGRAPGVPATRATVHPARFATTHGPSAGSGRLTCAGCHEQKFCSDCHDGGGGSRRRFHASNYMTRHAADAYGAEKTCTSCHSTESFCRSCHVSNGIAASSGSKTAAHNGQPLWLLQHSQAARQGLEGCTTCHQQRDCLRCHSNIGWGVSPHGSNFDASRYSSRNRQMCATCHLTDPLKQP